MGARLQARLDRLARSARGRRLLRRLARIAPARRAAHRSLLRERRRSRRWNEALVHLRALVALDPADRALRLELARIVFRLGFYDDSVEILEPLAAEDPSDHDALRLLAIALLRRRRFLEARRWLEASRAHDPMAARPLFLLGKTFEQAYDFAAARELYRQISALPLEDPGPQELRIRIGAEERLGDEGRPVELLRAALRAFPDSPRWTRQWLRELATQAPFDAEIQAIADAYLEAHPGDSSLWFVPLHRRVLAGDHAGVRRALEELDLVYREQGQWSCLMRAVHPAHFVHRHPDRPPPAARPARSDLAAVCCYFNPLGYRSRRRNFELFQRHLEATGVPLLTVELAFGDRPFELEGLGEVLQVRADDLMWQKERLLNLGIARLLERGWSKIAWLDADVVFEEPAWGDAVSRALDDHPVCQAFHLAHQRVSPDHPGDYRKGIVYWHRYRRGRMGHSGFAWAARAELLAEVPLYDTHVMGGGDLLIHLGCHREVGTSDYRLRYARIREEMSPGMSAGYDRWAKEWGSRVRGRVACAEVPLQTLYHGSVADRQYWNRYRVLRRHDFDPDRDLALDANGCWRWASDKPELHAEVGDYFRARREDAGGDA